MMQFKAIHGSRKQTKLFAQFVESLTTTDLQADDCKAMYKKMIDLISAFKGSHPRCNFYVQQGTYNWSTELPACFIYENYNVYITKSALLTIKNQNNNE